MALGGSTYLKSATMLEQLLEEINFQRTKEMRQLMKDGECTPDDTCITYISFRIHALVYFFYRHKRILQVRVSSIFSFAYR